MTPSASVLFTEAREAAKAGHMHEALALGQAALVTASGNQRQQISVFVRSLSASVATVSRPTRPAKKHT